MAFTSKFNTIFLKVRFKPRHCIKYARIRVFTDPYSPVYGQNLQFCLYTEESGSGTTRFLAYFRQ